MSQALFEAISSAGMTKIHGPRQAIRGNIFLNKESIPGCPEKALKSFGQSSVAIPDGAK